ncbi:MAG: hypothetical protein DWQ31_08165 [Planctomycetota bacterium]|nr:MAG: hypothetical protein DWQ31_08165 [Planctomycetota bacterium]REK40416.1 MAG: hypothetical protein DWQ46_16460 [Planctomycetota bacterium]
MAALSAGSHASANAIYLKGYGARSRRYLAVRSLFRAILGVQRFRFADYRAPGANSVSLGILKERFIDV